jgi:type I restriction enzyme M protein
MLDTDTKRRIDSCRDILVGKVPDPKSQVEQITIALIYKFMDDMDAQSEEFGGKRSFFVNAFEKYSWSKLLAPSMGGQDTLNLYSEAIGKMTENTHLPVLFRDIFKNAYLPYRDPETLKSFLKEVDWFNYEHSEKLGDAFEYLLSVLGSQGDAGQFRTPRHIIDFIVRVINPQKHERILDPACGTAGFLISAWKFIQECNKKTRPGDLLTPSERNKLAANIHGYDISPDMVRLSLVNLYLHGFTDPHVEEYDTLTSEDKWNEHFDVILANPPFMSPKGGIKPHKRFSIQATRSEVLFVDYIHEHLSPNGRAGIIVPEGIIFQNGTAYKTLRKMLVQNSVVAVVSLPAGVFQPYSGVKTSILILDKRLAKQTNKVLFVKITDDGFALGAQRRPIERNDIPRAEQALTSFFVDPAIVQESELAQVVDRDEILGSIDCSLSGERYRAPHASSAHYPMVKLGEICVVERGGSPRPIKDYITDADDGINWVKIGDAGENDKYIRSTKEKIRPEGAKKSRRVFPGDFLLSNSMSFGRPYIMATDGCIHDGWLLLRENGSRVLKDYLYWTLGSENVFQQFKRAATGGVVNNLNSQLVREVEIPLPPLTIQGEIVAEIESYQKIIDGARQVVENYQPRIGVQQDWPIVSLASVTFFQEGPGILAKDFRKSGIPLVRLAGLRGHSVTLEGCNYLDPEQVAAKWDHFKLEAGDILVLTSASFGRPAIVGPDAAGAIAYTGIIRFKPTSPDLDQGYLKQFLGSPNFLRQAESFASGAVIKHFGPTHLKQMTIPLPPIAVQREISETIRAEQNLVECNKELIDRFEAKIKAALNRVWVD